LDGDQRRLLVDPECNALSMRTQCRLLGIPRSCIYYSPVIKSVDDATLTLLRLVDEEYTKYPFFGTRKMAVWLNHNKGQMVSRPQMRTLYEMLGLRAMCPSPNTSKPHPEHKIYPYLLRDVKVTQPNQVWSTDITYIRLRKGFVYLVAIIDWYSRYVLAWDLSISMEAEFCVSTLARALEIAKCDIFNTDQGSQFTSKIFIDLLKAHHIQISMDGKGRALDNIFVERLWRSVKYECIYLQELDSVSDALDLLKKYFLFYNNERPHQALNYETPIKIYHGRN
jgi:putative transposase